MHYPYEFAKDKVAVSYGIIKEINKEEEYDFNHYCSTTKGSSGSPILNLSNNKVVGIHKFASNEEFNIGAFLYYPLKEFIDKYKMNEKEKEKKKERRKREYENIEDDYFDYRELKQFLNEIDSKKKNIILLSTGSYNPVHRMDLQIHNTAYNYLKDKFNVICSFISPSADCNVAYKDNILIPFEERCEMIKEAIQYYINREIYEPNFRIFLHNWEGSHNYSIDLPTVISEIQYKINKYYKQYNIRVLYICGMDYYLKYKNDLRQNVVVVDRKPYTNTRYETNEKNYVYLLKDEKNEPYSSTEIRNAFFQTGDLIEIKKITFPNVARMFIDFYIKEVKKCQ